MPQCAPCERAFEQAMKLCTILKKEVLSPEARTQARVVAESLKLVGEYLVDKKIREARLSGRATYKESE